MRTGDFSEGGGPVQAVVQYLLTGLTTGAIYALVAIGFVTIYNVTGVFNFAQGQFVMLGSLIMASLVQAKVPFAPALLLTVLAVTLVGAAIERLGIYPARKAKNALTLIMITMGFDIVIQGAALLIWGTDSYGLKPFSAGLPFRIAGAALPRQGLWIIGVCMLMLALLYYLANRTVLGMALRAAMANKVASRLVGVRPEMMSLLAFCISAALGAVGGIVMAPVTLATYDMGFGLGLKGFVAAVLGGLTSAPAAVLGGFVLGVLEAMGAGLVSTAYRDAIAFLVLLLVLFFRPNGLLEAISGKRV